MSISLLTPPPTDLPEVPFAQMVEDVRRSLPPDLPRDPRQLLVALDVDGTLLRPDGASPRVRAAFHDLVDAGATVVIATGRGIGATRAVFEYVGSTEGWAVCSNGSLLTHWSSHSPLGVDVVTAHTFVPGPSMEILREAIPGVLFGVETLRDGYLLSGDFPAGEFIERHRLAPVDEMAQLPTPKLVARAPWVERDDFARVVDALALPDVEYAVGWTSWADINPAGRTKAAGLRELTEQLGIPHEGTVAVGDGTNDIPMLEWAAHGVAMGGAAEEVRVHADDVTGPVEYDGAAAVMRAILDR